MVASFPLVRMMIPTVRSLPGGGPGYPAFCCPVVPSVPSKAPLPVSVCSGSPSCPSESPPPFFADVLLPAPSGGPQGTSKRGLSASFISCRHFWSVILLENPIPLFPRVRTIRFPAKDSFSVRTGALVFTASRQTWTTISSPTFSAWAGPLACFLRCSVYRWSMPSLRL